MKNNLVSILAYAENGDNEKIIRFVNEIMEEGGIKTSTVTNSVQIPLHRITDSASNGSVFPVVTEHFSASSDHAFL